MYMIEHLGKGKDPLQGHLRKRTSIIAPNGQPCVLLFICYVNDVPSSPNYVAPSDRMIVKNRLKRM